MNERIKQLVKQAGGHFSTHNLMSNPVQHRESIELWDKNIEKFAELIVAECRNVVTEVYRKTPLELCGPLLTADEEIAKHFYGVEE
jgi:hypothetical protein